MSSVRLWSGWMMNPDNNSDLLRYDANTDVLSRQDGVWFYRPLHWSPDIIFTQLTSLRQSGAMHGYGSHSEAAHHREVGFDGDPRQPRTAPWSGSSPLRAQAVEVQSQSIAHPSYYYGTTETYSTPKQDDSRRVDSVVISSLEGVRLDDKTPVPSTPGGQPAHEQRPKGKAKAGAEEATYSTGRDHSRMCSEDPELLYAEYKKREKDSRRFFSLGKVFQTLWSEPGTEQSVSSPTQKAWTKNSYGEWVYTKVWRFVVVKENLHDCQAVRVTSYSGQGVAKKGVKKADHAVIFTGKVAPIITDGEVPKPGETGMQPHPIRVDPDQRDEKLDPMSRIDFSRVYTIQHYQRVKSFGKVNSASMVYLDIQWRNVLLVQSPLFGISFSGRRDSTLSHDEGGPLWIASSSGGASRSRIADKRALYDRALSDLISKKWSYDDARAVLRDVP